jgi:Spy/CpxP family protein refolding chaperone
MKTSVFAIITIFLFATMFVSQSNAQGRMGNRQGMGQCFGTKMYTALNLTDAQKDKISSLKETHQKAMIDLKAQMQKDMLTLKDLRAKEGVSRNDVIAAVEKLNKSRDAMAIERANHMMDVRSVFTPEQRKMLKDKYPGMMMRGHNKGMRGKGMRGSGMGICGKCNF